MDINDLGVDLDGIKDPVSFLQGILWFVAAMREVNGNVRQDTFRFDGDEYADGIRMLIEKQDGIFQIIEMMAKSVLEREG